MKNRKGFTLVELLAVVVILGIVTLISLPVIRNISLQNEKKQYGVYEDSLKNSAKLYIDSHSKDIFGRKGTGCYAVTYQQLYEKGLIKDISLRGVSCNSTSTYVKVFKVDDNYGYYVNLGCGKVVNGVVQLPAGTVGPDTTCRVTDGNYMTIEVSPDSSAKSTKNKNVTVTITSSTGINPQSRIYYGVSTNPNSNTPDGEWQPLSMVIADKSVQKKNLINGTPTVVATKLDKLFEGLTGKYYLILRMENLTNLDGENWTNEDSNRLTFGTFIIDNSVPNLGTSRVVSSEAGYNALQPKLAFNVTDQVTDTLTGSELTNNGLKMCISYDTKTEASQIASCPRTVKEIRKTGTGSRYEAYNPTKTLAKIQPSYETDDPKDHEHTISITIADEAGNYVVKNFNYNVAYSVNYDKNTGDGATAPTYCDGGVTCTLRESGFAKVGYAFTGWYMAASGGNPITSLVLTRDIKVYAQWKACGPGTHSANNECQNCPVNTYSTGSANGSCTACPEGMTSLAGSSAKANCKVTCSAGKYLAKNGTSCSSCPAGKYCAGGTYGFSSSADQGITGNCNANTYSTGGASAATCTACPGSMISNAGSTSKSSCKTTCNAGQYLAKNESSCKNCPAGKYCVGGTFGFSETTDQVISGDCAINTYSTGGASTAACTACPTGMTSSVGSTAKSACKITCAAGKHLAASGTSCTACPAGKYCVGGTFGFSTSAQGITGNCNANTYSTGGAKVATCTGCPTGMTSNAGSTAKSACKVTCAAGKYLAKNGTSCSNCPAGKYCVGGSLGFSSSADQGVTGNCNANTYSTGGASAATCTACPAGYSSTAGSTAKNKCSISCSANTRVATADAKCTACGSGYGISAHTVTAGNTSAACTATSRKITYNGNGNTGGSTAATTCDYNQDCTLRSNGFTKSGYSFDGWYSAASGGTKYGSTVRITSNIIVYAHWKQNPSITYSNTQTSWTLEPGADISCSGTTGHCSVVGGKASFDVEANVEGTYSFSYDSSLLSASAFDNSWTWWGVHGGSGTSGKATITIQQANPTSGWSQKTATLKLIFTPSNTNYATITRTYTFTLNYVASDCYKVYDWVWPCSSSNSTHCNRWDVKLPGGGSKMIGWRACD